MMRAQTGQEIYENKFELKTNKYVMNSKYKSVLNGFISYISDNLSVSTVNRYVYYVAVFLNETDKQPDELNIDDYSEHMRSLARKTSTYRIAVYSALKTFSRYLSVRGVNKADPMQYIQRPKAIESQTTIEKREKGFLSAEELEKQLRSVQTGVGTDSAKKKQEHWRERDRALILLMVTTGMRCAAVYKLNVTDINFEERYIMTNEKGRKVRRLPLPEQTAQALKEWIALRKKLLHGTEEDALFISNRRQRMSQESIGVIVRKYSQDIEGKNITPHKLRATFGTMLYEKTHDIYLVQQGMNHSNPHTTERYIRGQERANMERISNIMSSVGVG